MVLIWQCNNCDFSDTLINLNKTILEIKYHNDILKTKVTLAVEECTEDSEFNDTDDFRTWESYMFTCPNCGYSDDWFFDDHYTTLYEKYSIKIKLPDGRYTYISMPKMRPFWKGLIK